MAPLSLDIILRSYGPYQWSVVAYFLDLKKEEFDVGMTDSSFDSAENTYVGSPQPMTLATFSVNSIKIPPEFNDKSSPPNPIANTVCFNSKCRSYKLLQ